MKLREWVKAERGRLKFLAEAVSVTPGALYQFTVKRVPAERVIAIERATGGQVTRHEMRPDVYPE